MTKLKIHFKTWISVYKKERKAQMTKLKIHFKTWIKESREKKGKHR